MVELEPRTLQEALVRAVRATCPDWLAGEVDDLAQAAAVKILELVGREPRDRALAPSYLWKTAHSVVIDEIRRRSRRPELALDPRDLAAIPDGRRTPSEEQASRQGLREAIRACLRRLLAPRRRAVILHLHGERLAEIARLFGWSPKRTDNLVYRGLADLRACLAEKGFADDRP